jgi:hypothetical protein
MSLMTTKPFKNHREIIDAIGIDVLVDVFSATNPKTLRPHVRQMRYRNSIPVLFWEETARAARRAEVSGITSVLLHSTRPIPKPRAAPKPKKTKKTRKSSRSRTRKAA